MYLSIRPLSTLLHALDEGAERIHLRPKEKVTKLSISEEHDKEHDRKSKDVLRTSTQRRGQLSHRLVETDVFENL